MPTKATLALIILIFMVQPIMAQALFESQATRGLSAGLGSGLAASMGNGKAVQNSYAKMVDAQKYLLALTNSINKSMAEGCAHEKAKQWKLAESYFRYTLQLVARRDGPGSTNSVPALKHLVVTSTAQNKFDDAISFQTTVLQFVQSPKLPDYKAVFREQMDLASIYVLKHDYTNAVLVLQKLMAQNFSNVNIDSKDRLALKLKYAEVLRKLNREHEATVVEGLDILSIPAASVTSAEQPKLLIPMVKGELIKPQPPTAGISVPINETSSSQVQAPEAVSTVESGTTIEPPAAK